MSNLVVVLLAMNDIWCSILTGRLSCAVTNSCAVCESA